MPQRHCPLEQLSARWLSQATQAAPDEPQVLNELTVQVAPLQQPVGHEAESQRQTPPTQCCPAPHGACVPQRHWPVAQLSALSRSHAIQAEPSVPHEETELSRQTLPSQHPPLQLLASHPFAD